MSKKIGTSGRRAAPSVILAGMMLLACLTGQAYAVDQCAALGGALVGGECRINSLVSKAGSFTLDETLRITSTGNITVPAAGGGNALTLNITGRLIMDAGRISGEWNACDTSSSEMTASRGIRTRSAGFEIENDHARRVIQ